ncbi:tetratricopeptide repeat protein 19 homolog, mitochondrial [Battus philenor]|uniref:tetratricopeptide repeat protein 19 homolog, mitochondrial n=1 Tax=Battus philenor TaxID=42288 RepID=UPI0035D0520F
MDNMLKTEQRKPELLNFKHPFQLYGITTDKRQLRVPTWRLVTQRIMADGAKEDDVRVIHISIKLARISYLKNEYSTAKLGYEWCLQKLENLAGENNEDIVKLIAMAEDWYGRLLVDLENSEKGLNLMISSLNRMQKTNVEQEHVIVQMNDIGTVCDRLGKYDEGIKYLLKAIELGKQMSAMDELGTMYVNLGRIYMKQNLLEMARKSCGQGWKLGVTTKNDNLKHEAELCFKELKL